MGVDRAAEWTVLLGCLGPLRAKQGGIKTCAQTSAGAWGLGLCRVAIDRWRCPGLHAGRQQSTLVALNKKSGELVWKARAGGIRPRMLPW